VLALRAPAVDDDVAVETGQIPRIDQLAAAGRALRERFDGSSPGRLHRGSSCHWIIGVKTRIAE
jgi:hypothetical protein